jgi:hypothetical protein
MLRSIDKFHKKRLGYLVFGLVELVLSYLFVRLAFPSGDWWEWLLMLVFLVGALKNFVRMLARMKSGRG